MPYIFPDRKCSNCERFDGALAYAPIVQSELMVAFINERQRSRGALVVAPRRHILTLEEMTNAERKEMARVVAQVAAGVRDSLKPDGVHHFCNAGEPAGQSEPHLHVQIVPRYADAEYGFGPSDDIPLTSLSEQMRIAHAIAVALNPLPEGEQ